MRRASVVALLAALALPGTASADEERRLPVPEPGVAGKLVALNDCVAESEYDTPSWYGAECRRLKIVFGPIVVNPGKNDVLIQPVTFEKPMWDGYMVRFKPGLVDFTGATPPVESLHLHHGTWLNAAASSVGRSYGSGPWLATGEEKTIAAWPKGYGLKIQGNDAWLFLHMVHSAVASPTVVYATYDIDYVAADYAEQLVDGQPRLRNTKGIWLDVGGGGAWSDGAPNDDQYRFNPVYNTQAGFGEPSEGTVTEFSVSDDDAETYGLGDTTLDLCNWPDDNCARENSSGRVSRNQGNDVSDKVDGWDWNVGATFDGSLVVMGGHLHMGGVNDTVSLVREFTGPNGEKRRFSKLIHISDAYYWNWDDPTKVGAPPISWDVSMSGVSADFGWKIRVRQGDKIRLNAEYETSIASWYENMGIVMTWVAPGDTSGVDPFRGCSWDGASSSLTGCEVTIENGLLPDRDSTGPITVEEVQAGYDTGNWSVNTPEAAPGYVTPGADLPTCHPDADTICTRGQVTHGHVSSSGNHAGCQATGCSPALLDNAPEWQGGHISEIHMGGFLYAPGDFTQIPLTGIPTVELGDTVTFISEDGPLYIPHTATLCGYPCTGPVTTHYPIPDGGQPVVATPDPNDDPDLIVVDPVNGDKELDTMDFDTTELGLNIGATQNLDYELKTTRTGVFTYFCRIHPFMRGAFEVVEPSAN